MVPEGVGRRIILSKKGSKLIARLIIGKSVDDLIEKDPRVVEPKPEPVVAEAQATGK